MLKRLRFEMSWYWRRLTSRLWYEPIGVSDRTTGELMAYVAPALSEMTAREFIGWSPWPQKVHV